MTNAEFAVAANGKRVVTEAWKSWITTHDALNAEKLIKEGKSISDPLVGES